VPQNKNKDTKTGSTSNYTTRMVKNINKQKNAEGDGSTTSLNLRPHGLHKVDCYASPL